MDGFSDGHDERTHVKDADDSPSESFVLTRLSLQFRARCLGGHPATGRVCDYQNLLLLIIDQRFEDVENDLGVLVSLGISSLWRSSVEVGLVDVAHVELRKVGSRQLRAMGIYSGSLERLDQRQIGRRSVVAAMADDYGKV